MTALLRALALACVLAMGEGEMAARMTTSDAGKSFLTLQEGVRLRAYRDVVGVWTVGVGHTSAAGPPEVRQGMTITSEEAMVILARDLRKFERAVLDATRGVELAQHEFDALVSLAFNIGPRAFARSSVVRYLLAEKRRRAGDAFRMWRYAGGRIIAGLVARRRRERRLFLDGVYTGVTIHDGQVAK